MTPENWELHLVTGLSEVEQFLEWVDRLDGPVAIDTETTGLKWWTPNFARLVQFGAGDVGYAVPVEWWGKVVHWAMQHIADRALPVVFHNAKFDMHALEGDGFPVPEWHNVQDTMTLDHLLIPHENHRLKAMCGRRFGEWALLGQSELRKDMAAGGWSWDTVPVDLPSYWQYGVLDTLLTWHAYDRMMPLVQELYPEQYGLEMTVQSVMYETERRGIRIDATYTAALRTQYQREAAALGRELELEGVPNPNSNKQLEGYLRDLGWEPDQYTQTGAAKMDKHVMRVLSGTWPAAEKIMRFKRISKWGTTYLDKFLNDRDSNNRVHPSIHTLQARTGRFSITDPPFQTLPSGGSGGDIRRCVVPEPRHTLWSIDYRAQEACLFASYSGDVAMLDCLARGEDLYAFTASVIYNVAVAKSDPLRDTTKVTMLAYLYGAGVATLAVQTGQTPAEVEGFLGRLYEVFPGVRDLTGDHALGGKYPGGPALSSSKNYAEHGLHYIHTGGGRRFSVPSQDERYKMVNGLMQGTGADVLKSAIVRLHQAGLSQYIVVPVHDELLFQFPSESGTVLSREAATLMEDHNWPAPLRVDITGPLSDWGAAYR